MPAINQSIPEVFDRRCRETPDSVWMIWKDASGARQQLTWSKGRADVERAARGLMQLGLDVQDRVGIFSKNRPEWVLADLGAIHAACIPVPVYDTLAGPQIKHIAHHSEMRVLFVANLELLERVLSIRQELPKLERAILFEGSPPSGAEPFVMTWDALLKLGEAHKASNPELFEKRSREMRRDDLLTLVYTSGTTGDPKGVMLTQGNILFQIETLPRVVPISAEDLTISYLPLAHIFERTVGEFLPIQHGNMVAYTRAIETLGDDIREYRPTYLLAVPRVLEKMYDRVLDNVRQKRAVAQRIFWWAIRVGQEWEQLRHEKRPPLGIRIKHRVAQRLVYEKVKEALGGRLRFVVSGAAPLNPKLTEFFLALDVPIMEGYGLTETSPVISVNPIDAIVPGSVGTMIPGIQVEIWEKFMQGSPPETEGEIVTKGPHVMKGYYKDDKSTKETVDREGWLHTGDIGKRDARGYIRITDRKKNIIVNSYGKNVAPGPIEARIGSSKYVSSVMLIGDKHKYVVALITPNFLELEAWATGRGVAAPSRAELITRPEVSRLYRDLLDEAGKDFSQPEQVRKFALLDHEFTVESGILTPTLKVKRALVEKQYAGIITAMYADEHEFSLSQDIAGATVPGAGSAKT